MANEHVLFYETEKPIPMTVANGTGINKGALLKLSDPLTAASQTAQGDLIAGVAASEKVASDGKVRLGVFRGGIFKAKASGAITVGDPLRSEINNLLSKAVGALSGQKIVGTSLETAADAETFLYELRPNFLTTAGATQ